MESMGKRLWAIAIVLGTFFPMLSSCKRYSKTETVQRCEGQYGYAGVYLDIPEKEGYKLYDIGDIFLDNGMYCTSVIYSRYDEKTNTRDFLTDILTVDLNGEVQYTLEITKMQVVRAVFDQEYAFFAYSDQDLLDVQNGIMDPAELKADLVFFDKKTGDTTRVIHPQMKAESVFAISDGFVVAGERKIEKYTSDGELQSTIQTEFPLYQNSTVVFENAGSIYLLAESNEWASNYYKLDFSVSKMAYIVGTDSLSEDMEYCSGLYYFSPQGEFRVDLDKMQIQTMALWNEIDIRPKKMSDAEQRYIALDDTHFAQKTIYMDGTGDIAFFSYDNTINRDRTQITIGGYDIYFDEALKWAVYNFNTKNDEYRVVLEDYSADFSYSTPQEAQTARLKLMKYFNEGHTPDIFYGEKFDYEYFGRAGMVIDMLPFFEKDSELDISDLVPSVCNTIVPDGKHCYSVFSSFYITGYYGLKSDFADNTVSLLDIQEKTKDTDKQFTSVQSSPCIAVEALSHSFQNYWGAYEKEKTISRKDVEQFVSSVINLGVDPSVSWGTICTLDEVYNGQYYLASSGPSDLFDLALEERKAHDRITYVGFPSLEGSVHLIRPTGIVGISSSTKHPEQCWEVIREMLLPDTQKKIALTHNIPVNSEVLGLMYESAQDPDHVSDEDMKRFVLGHEAVSVDVIEDYQEFIDSVDTVYTSDWGAYNIINEEISSYYTQQRSIEQIAETLDKRLTLYVQEKY